MKDVVELFKDVKKDNMLGKGAKWPAPPKVLARACEMLKKIHVYWRAWYMLSRLDEKQKEIVRTKIVTYDIFHKNKVWEYTIFFF